MRYISVMNDTLAIIGTPIALYFAEKHNISPKLLLLCLAYGITTGSVMSPIGNPQNLLIAVNGNLNNPFISFFKYLTLPTLINMFLIYVVLKYFYRDQFDIVNLEHVAEPLRDYYSECRKKRGNHYS